MLLQNLHRRYLYIIIKLPHLSDLEQRLPNFLNCDNYGLLTTSNLDPLLDDTPTNDNELHQVICNTFKIDYYHKMDTISRLQNRLECKINHTLPALLPNKLNTMKQGLATSGEGIRNKRAIPALAIIQGIAAIEGMMIKGINALVDAHLLKKCMEHTCMSAIYYDQGSNIKAKQCKTIVTFDTILESKILDASNLLILLNLQKPWTIACKDISRVFEIEYSTYRILNRSELCECSLTAGNYLLSYMNINCGNAPEARDGYFTTYYSFNNIVLDIITEKFDIQVDENTKNQAYRLHDDIPGYDLPTIDFVQTTTDQDEDVSILEEDILQIYAYLDNVLVHMIDNQQTAIFKSNQDFNKNKEKISQYIKYAENWQVASVICSYTVMACDVLLIVAMIVFLLKYRKTMQAMLASFLQTNTKNTGIQSVQADLIGRTYPPLFTLNLPKEEEIIDNLREITTMAYVVQVLMIIVCIAIVLIIMYTHTIFKYCLPFLLISHMV